MGEFDMIREEYMDELTTRLAGALKECGFAESVPSLEPIGPMTVVLDLAGLSHRRAQAFAQTVEGLPGVVTQSLIWLDEWKIVTGESVGEDDDRRLVFDVEKSRCSFSPDEIAECRKDNVIEIPHAWRKGKACAFLPMSAAFYDAIADGRKKVECRDYNEYWARRLLGPKVTEVILQRGYVKDAPQMRFAIDRVELEDCDGSRYVPGVEPEMAIPSLILVHLGERLAGKKGQLHVCRRREVRGR